MAGKTYYGILFAGLGTDRDHPGQKTIPGGTFRLYVTTELLDEMQRHLTGESSHGRELSESFSIPEWDKEASGVAHSEVTLHLTERPRPSVIYERHLHAALSGGMVNIEEGPRFVSELGCELLLTKLVMLLMRKPGVSTSAAY